MKKANDKSGRHPILGDFEPIEDLLYHDCPYVFTFRDAMNGLAIAYLIHSDGRSTRYLGVRITDQDLHDLKKGVMPLRKAFQDWAWDIALDEGAKIISVSKRTGNELDPRDLPPPDLRIG
jgi:hypothetical protein